MSAKRGRRPGRPDTRTAILEAAREAFVEHGYRGATVRRIAEQADVDLRLIAYHFGSKKGLFAEAMTLPLSPSDVLGRALAEPPHAWAPEILSAILQAWDTPETGRPLQQMLLVALNEPEQRRALSEFVERELVDALSEHVDGPSARRRATAAITVIMGLILNRYVLGVAPLRDMSQSEVVATLRPLLQSALHPRPTRLTRQPPGRVMN